MERRKFLVGLGSASIGGSALVGSGAFSRVESQRGVTIEVAEDPYAYLGLAKCGYPDDETPNSSYAHLDGDGHLEILMNDENPDHLEGDLGAGVNSDSMTWFHNVFQICNQGKETVCVHIEEFETLDNHEDYDEPTVDFYLGDGDYDGVHERSIVGEENHFELEVGDCVCVGIKTVTKGRSEGDELLVDGDITIVADVECPDEPRTPGEENGDPKDPEEPEEVDTDHPAISWVSFCVEEGSISAEDISKIDVTQIKKGEEDFDPVQIEWEVDENSDVEVSNVTLKGGTEFWHFDAGGTSGTVTMGDGYGPKPQYGQKSQSPCPEGSCGVKFEWDEDNLEFELEPDHQDTC